MGKRGLLTFKGDSAPLHQKKKKKSSSAGNDEAAARSSATGGMNEDSNAQAFAAATSTTLGKPDTLPSLSAASTDKSETKNAGNTPTSTLQTGTGKITVSGTVVTGHGTCFMREIQPGDALVVMGPEGQPTEMRVVTMRLSDISLNLSSALAQSVARPTGFYYMKKTRGAKQVREEQEKKKERLQEEEREREMHAFGIYTSKKKDNGNEMQEKGQQEVVYRERTEHGSYRIKKTTVSLSGKESAEDALSRGKLLELRSKKTSDKYC
jgi:hypothetical protein